jgi:diacylglycerol kinase family enzyme
MLVVVIHNPSAGDNDVVRHELIELISRSGHRVEYFESYEPWEPELQRRPDLVCVAGGDGTVAPVARAASQHRVPVTILPMGTANNVAQFLGLQGVPFDELIRGWSRARHQPFDLGVARGSWGEYRFLESIGVGLIADLIAEVDRGDASHVNDVEQRTGRIDAALEVLEDLVNRADPITCELCGDNFTVSGEYLLVEVMNFGAAGPNLKLAPAADGADGLLDVVFARVEDRRVLADYLAAQRLGSYQGTSPLHVRRTDRVRVRCPMRNVHLDDELRSEPDGSLTIDATIEPHAVTFLIPASAQRT